MGRASGTGARSTGRPASRSPARRRRPRSGGLGVAEHEVALLGEQGRVERHRHDAHPQGAEHRRQHGAAARGEERHALPAPMPRAARAPATPALLVLGGLGREQLDGHRGRSPVARRVLPVSR